MLDIPYTSCPQTLLYGQDSKYFTQNGADTLPYYPTGE